MVTGSVSRLVVLLVLLAATAIPAGGLLCLTACAPEESALAEGGGHCEHTAGPSAPSLTAFPSSCDDCDQRRLDVADRIASRSSLGMTAPPSIHAIEYAWPPSVRVDSRHASGPALPWHVPLEPHRPLRI